MIDPQDLAEFRDDLEALRRQCGFINPPPATDAELMRTYLAWLRMRDADGDRWTLPDEDEDVPVVLIKAPSAEIVGYVRCPDRHHARSVVEAWNVGRHHAGAPLGDWYCEIVDPNHGS